MRLLRGFFIGVLMGATWLGFSYLQEELSATLFAVLCVLCLSGAVVAAATAVTNRKARAVANGSIIFFFFFLLQQLSFSASISSYRPPLAQGIAALVLAIVYASLRRSTPTREPGPRHL